MKKMKTSGNLTFSKIMLAVVISAGLFFTFSGNANAQETYNGEEVFVVADEMPTFPGETKGLYQALTSNLKYPQSAKDNGIEGKVMIKFIVDKEGAVKNPVIIRSVDPTLDKAALDAVKMLPKFKPGKKGGKPVNVYYSVPITFQLS